MRKGNTYTNFPVLQLRKSNWLLIFAMNGYLYSKKYIDFVFFDLAHFAYGFQRALEFHNRR